MNASCQSAVLLFRRLSVGNVFFMVPNAVWLKTFAFSSYWRSPARNDSAGVFWQPRPQSIARRN